jgi:KDO2-lipid IV(A) lauroyltransferase
MKLLAYILVYPLLWLISKLPFRMLYAFSDFVYLLVFYVVRYRRKTVQNNLKIALPHLSEAEHKRIEKEFYHYMCDMFLEMIKTLSISAEEMDKRFRFTNIEVIREYEKKQKSIVLMFAHYASWEWSVIMGKHTKFKAFGIYKKIQNPYFDKMMRDIRSKFDAELISTKSTIKEITQNQEKGILGLYGFISDQTPRPQKTHYWEEFMGRMAPIHTGGEMLAKKLDMSTVFMKVEKVKRGYYQATFIPLAENSREVPDYQITYRFIKEVEKQILEKPEYYFWTHKRWKHSKKD